LNNRIKTEFIKKRKQCFIEYLKKFPELLNRLKQIKNQGFEDEKISKSIEYFEGKLKHIETRLNLYSNEKITKKTKLIIEELLSRRYQNFSGGIKGFLMDVFIIFYSSLFKA